MQFQASDLSNYGDASTPYLAVSTYTVGDTEGFRQFARYVIDAIKAETGGNASIPVANVVDPALKVKQLKDLAPYFGKLKTIAQSFKASKTSDGITKAAAWFYNKYEKSTAPARAPGKAPAASTDLPLPEAPKAGIGGWISDNKALAAGIGIGALALIGGGIYHYTRSAQ